MPTFETSEKDNTPARKKMYITEIRLITSEQKLLLIAEYKSIFQAQKIGDRQRRQWENPNLFHKVIKEWNSASYNRYTPLTLNQANCRKHFFHKIVFDKCIYKSIQRSSYNNNKTVIQIKYWINNASYTISNNWCTLTVDINGKPNLYWGSTYTAGIGHTQNLEQNSFDVSSISRSQLTVRSQLPST